MILDAIPELTRTLYRSKGGPRWGGGPPGCFSRTDQSPMAATRTARYSEGLVTTGDRAGAGKRSKRCRR